MRWFARFRSRGLQDDCATSEDGEQLQDGQNPPLPTSPNRLHRTNRTVTRKQDLVRTSRLNLNLGRLVFGL